MLLLYYAIALLGFMLVVSILVEYACKLVYLLCECFCQCVLLLVEIPRRAIALLCKHQ